MKKQHIKVLDEIQVRANEKFKDRLWKEQPKADVMLEVIDKALNEEKNRFDKDELDKLQTIKESHILDGTERVIDVDVAKEMDEFISQEVDKAIKEKKLPPRDTNPFIKKIKQKHARGNRKD